MFFSRFFREKKKNIFEKWKFRKIERSNFWKSENFRIFQNFRKKYFFSKKFFRSKKKVFRKNFFIQSRDMVYVRSIKPKERVCNKFGWVLKIDIEKSWDFGFFAKNHRLFGIFSEKPYLNVLQWAGFWARPEIWRRARCRFLKPIQTCCRLVLCV